VLPRLTTVERFLDSASLRTKDRAASKVIEIIMPRKSRTHRQTQPTMSPLLRALTYSRAAHEPVTDAMLLQAYVSLDAFRRGHGSRDLFTTLARQLLVAAQLCRLGHQPEAMADIERAQGAMIRIDAAHEKTPGRPPVFCPEGNALGGCPAGSPLVGSTPAGGLARSDSSGGAKNAEGSWRMDDADYALLCLALEIFTAQLATACLGDIAKAETQMLEGILRAERKLATA
jgi:hypothetical protein